MLLDYMKLFEPYTGDGHSLDRLFRWLEKEAQTSGIEHDTIELALLEIFTEAASGKQYPIDKCPCGCGIDKAGTAITHAIRERMLDIDGSIRIKKVKILNDRHNTALLTHIHNQNEEYLAKHLPKKKKKKNGTNGFTDWDKSPVLNGVKKANGFAKNGAKKIKGVFM